MDNVLFPSLYEQDYILRSLGTIVSQPDVALTELVANAWDAGASNVNIFIPEEYHQILYIEDDGVGMSEEEFQRHWMTLRYNRLANQGRDVIFPQGVNNKRTAFGRNGVGRHGLFCFGEEYKVIAIVGNKFDLYDREEVEEINDKMVEEYINILNNDNKCKFFHMKVSAKTGVNVTPLFIKLPFLINL